MHIGLRRCTCTAAVTHAKEGRGRVKGKERGGGTKREEIMMLSPRYYPVAVVAPAMPSTPSDTHYK